ncbi:MAG: peptidase M20 [Planctomycetaceae bacterium]|nr:peptidase M20 [Planctomycetaceae bacterium]
MPSPADYLLENDGRFIEELLEFLKIPSISALPDHAGDVANAAEWVAGRLRQAGVPDVTVLSAGGVPTVYGEWLGAGDAPTILVYGHFDTQPVDPVDLWTDPPFSPVIRDERIYARGASDDKGNLLIPILAAEAWLKTAGSLPINVKFLFEGEEEIGSPHVADFVEAHRDRLACDFVVSADGGQWSEDQPNLLVGFKGLCAVQLDLVGPARDLHSGMYGGTVQNPIHALARLITSMRDDEGRIRVAGFYDSVVTPSESDREQIGEIPGDDTRYAAELGVEQLFGEPGFSTRERAWTRPTLEFNGIWGGFTGEGVKTVLPSQAHAKITCRLVPDQEPPEIVACIQEHVRQFTPPGASLTVTASHSGARPYQVPADHPGNLAARDVLTEIYGRPPYLTRTGGTLPICSVLHEKLGVFTVVFSFALDDERAHAPDEFFRLASFRRGQQAWSRLWERIAEPS